MFFIAIHFCDLPLLKSQPIDSVLISKNMKWKRLLKCDIVLDEL